MASPWSILCDDPAAAVEVARLGAELGVGVAPRVTPGPVREAVAALQRGERVALLLLGVPGEDELVGLARAADIAGSPVPLAVFGGTERSERA